MAWRLETLPPLLVLHLKLPHVFNFQLFTFSLPTPAWKFSNRISFYSSKKRLKLTMFIFPLHLSTQEIFYYGCLENFSLLLLPSFPALNKLKHFLSCRGRNENELDQFKDVWILNEIDDERFMVQSSEPKNLQVLMRNVQVLVFYCHL